MNWRTEQDGNCSSPIRYIEEGCLIINQDYVNFFDSIGIDNFDSIWGLKGGTIVKNIRQRSVIRITLHDQDRERIFYLKRHKPEFMCFRRLIGLLFSNRAFSQGKKEFHNICDFRKNGLPTVAAVAAGEKRFRHFWFKSFVITEDFSPYISLEKILREMPGFFGGPDGDIRKKTMLTDVATLARKMHQSGFNHLDFNATHILLYYEKGSDIPKTALFDLQRVDRKKLFRFRWVIKSLARLNYTLPADIFTAADRLDLIKSYKCREDLNVFDRIQWFWIKRKTARIQGHVLKKRLRRQAVKVETVG